jgi:hypothetical protein
MKLLRAKISGNGKTGLCLHLTAFSHDPFTEFAWTGRGEIGSS